jgi:hypothetical protein
VALWKETEESFDPSWYVRLSQVWHSTALVAPVAPAPRFSDAREVAADAEEEIPFARLSIEVADISRASGVISTVYASRLGSLGSGPDAGVRVVAGVGEEMRPLPGY